MILFHKMRISYTPHRLSWNASRHCRSYFNRTLSLATVSWFASPIARLHASSNPHQEYRLPAFQFLAIRISFERIEHIITTAIAMSNQVSHCYIHNPTASMSLINTAICALFAASATRLKSLRKGDTVLASLTPLCDCACCWLGACAWFADAAGCDVYEDAWEVDVDGAPWKYCDGCESEGEESGAFIVGCGLREAEGDKGFGRAGRWPGRCKWLR